jgi:hypothetical protein
MAMGCLVGKQKSLFASRTSFEGRENAVVSNNESVFQVPLIQILPGFRLSEGQHVGGNPDYRAILPV